MKISAVIITYNEEKNIRDAIASVSFADEILVVDSESSDSTVAIAESMNARVIVRPWRGFSEQKQFGVETANFDWIISIDGDERITPELAAEIAALKGSVPTADGFRIPRLSVYMGREIRHSGWYPDLQLRLFDRRKAKWNGRLIHESVEMNRDASTSQLSGDILHFSVEDAAHHHQMIGERYAPLAAAEMFRRGRRTSTLKVAFAGLAAFLRSYFLKLGFLDGFPGFCIARFAAHHAYLKHLMLWEMQQGESTK